MCRSTWKGQVRLSRGGRQLPGWGFQGLEMFTGQIWGRGWVGETLREEALLQNPASLEERKL